MHIVHVQVRVQSHFVGSFIEATVENARLSRLEPGVARFDFLQDKANPESFVLNEVYRSAEASIAHKATAHYQKWRDTVAEMMAEPRTRVECANIFPGDEGW